MITVFVILLTTIFIAISVAPFFITDDVRDVVVMK